MKWQRRGCAFRCLLFVIAGLAISERATAESAKGTQLLYIATETREESLGKGIYAFRLNKATGALIPLGLAAETPTPSALALHPNGKFLYSANEISKHGLEKNGPVSAFRIDDEHTGKLTFLNTAFSGGAGACHLSIDRSGKRLLVANVSGGSVAVLPVKTDGSLGPPVAFMQHSGSGLDPFRQKGPRTHAIVPSPDDRFALACDLGLDKVFIYRFDVAKGSLAPNDPPFAQVKPGSGPRHLAFHTSGRFVYVLNELNSTLSVFSYDPRQGALKESQTLSTLPADFNGESSGAEVEVHPTGRFVYSSNRGHDSIAVFAVNRESGALTPVQYALTHGKEPRTFAIDPSGSYLLAANRQSDTVTVFTIDYNTGRLSPAGEPFRIHAPVCILFVPAGSNRHP